MKFTEDTLWMKPWVQKTRLSILGYAPDNTIILNMPINTPDLTFQEEFTKASNMWVKIENNMQIARKLND